MARGWGSRRLARWFVVAPIGALIGVGLSVIPATTAHAEVVHHTLARDVVGLLTGVQTRVLPFNARHVAVHWLGNPDAVVTVAFSTDGVGFGPAIPVDHDEVGMQRDNGETYGAILAANGATVARLTTDRYLGRVTVLALADGPTSVVQTAVGKGQAEAGTDAAGAVSRAAWGADEGLRFSGARELWPPVFQTVQKLVVHHTGGVNGETGEAARATIRAIYYYHAVTQGWGDIGYNFLIDAAGVVYKGRSSHDPGSTVDTLTGENAKGQGVTAGHAFGYNSGTVGIAMLGTYTTVDASDATKAALMRLLVAKAKAHGLDPAKQGVYTNPLTGTQATFENVPGHREVPDNATECPGGYFLDTVLPRVRGEVQRAAGPADTTAPSDPTGAVATLGTLSMVVTWTASPGDTGNPGGGTSGVAGYDVWRSLLGGAPSRIGSTNGLAFTDNAGPLGALYDYVVKTYDGAGNRSPGRTAVKSI